MKQMNELRGFKAFVLPFLPVSQYQGYKFLTPLCHLLQSERIMLRFGKGIYQMELILCHQALPVIP